MKFTIDIQGYLPVDDDNRISTSDIEEAIREILDDDGSDGILIVEAADEEARKA